MSTSQFLEKIGGLGVFVQGARFIPLNPDPNLLTRDIMPLGKRIQALPWLSPAMNSCATFRLNSMLWERCRALAFIL